MVFDVRFRIVKKEEENGDQEDDETQRQRERETESKVNGNDSTGSDGNQDIGDDAYD